MSPEKTEQRRYQGYCATPPLWREESVTSFPQILLPNPPTPARASATFHQQRLGKRIEEYVFHQLKNSPSVTWIADSLQIQQGKRTVGEIDALFYDGQTPVHLEVAYKFYLYDTLEPQADPLSCWIGPNRKDNLALKLHKLRSKQFPLLDNPLTQPYLEALDLEAQKIEQRICFLGQLFLPYGDERTTIEPLNPACVAGVYLSFREVELLHRHAFFVPPKLDWLIQPHHTVDWLAYPEAKKRIKFDLDQGRSPLIWLRGPAGRLRKCFVVFW